VEEKIGDASSFALKLHSTSHVILILLSTAQNVTSVSLRTLVFVGSKVSSHTSDTCALLPVRNSA
jgi:hypothetical protein